MKLQPAADNDTPTYFIDEGSHKFRTELPNLIDDLGLSIFAHRLYAHIKRRAGEGDEGACTAGLRSMAKACGMSLGKASDARWELLDLGLIRARKETRRDGGFYEVLIVADIWSANFTFYKRRKWGQLTPFAMAEGQAAAARAHVACFLVECGLEVVRRRPEGKGEPAEMWTLEDARAHLATFLSDGVHVVNTEPAGVHATNGGVHVMNGGCSPHEHKKEPSGRRPNEEPTHRARARATPSPRSAEAGGGGSESRFGLEERKAHARRHGLGGGWLTNSRDGRYDDSIALDLEPSAPSPAEVGRGCAAAQLGVLSLAVAKTRVASTLSAPHAAPPAAVVEELFSSGQISDETRARLLEVDFSSAAPAARGKCGSAESAPAVVRGRFGAAAAGSQ